MDTALERRPGSTVDGTIDKKCRICFQTEAVPRNISRRPVRGKERPPLTLLEKLWTATTAKELEPESDDGFVAPCRCTGSMAWVHRSCLRIWRSKSPRRDSFYQCEQCFTPYRFRHTLLATLSANQFTIKLLSGMALSVSLLLSVMFVSLFIPVTFPESGYTPTLYSMGGIYSRDSYPTTVPQPRGMWTTPTTRTVEPKRPRQGNPRRRKGVPDGFSTIPTTTTHSVPNSETRRRRTMRRYAKLSPHSPISYLNVGYWMTGHSMDEGEDARNDFLAAVLDLGMLELWPAAIGLLAFVALVREGTQSSCLASCVLLISTVLLYIADWHWAIWMYPVPAGYGLVRFALYVDEVVDSTVNTFVKWTSSEIDDQFEQSNKHS